MYIIETASMMNDAGTNISLLCIRLRSLRYKTDVNFFKPETKMTDLCGEMIDPQFGEYTW